MQTSFFLHPPSHPPNLFRLRITRHAYNLPDRAPRLHADGDCFSALNGTLASLSRVYRERQGRTVKGPSDMTCQDLLTVAGNGRGPTSSADSKSTLALIQIGVEAMPVIAFGKRVWRDRGGGWERGPNYAIGLPWQPRLLCSAQSSFL